MVGQRLLGTAIEYRDLLHNALPNGDTARLNLLALGVINIPVLVGLIGVAQRYFSSGSAKT